jgi:small-conductance mechanosensitive channel
MNQYIIMRDMLSQYSLFGNTAWQYLVAAGVFLGTIIVLKIFQSIILARLHKLAKKTKTDFDDAVLEALSDLKFSFYVSISLIITGRYLVLSEKIITPLFVILFLIIIKDIIQSVVRMIDYSMSVYMRNLAKEERAHTKSMMRILRGLVMLLIWGIALLLLLSNLGVDVTSLVASLGIGGLAVALALQNILGDVFSSFSIFIDKPFQVGDYISIGGDNSGTVEHIGLKTTRLKTLRGEELVVPNKELTTSKVQNFKKLERRRGIVSLVVVYETSQKKLATIPSLVEKVIGSVEGADFSRCHLVKLADSGLEYEVAYYIDSPDYVVFSNIREAVLLSLNDMCRKEKVVFAYPTQTLKVEK